MAAGLSASGSQQTRLLIALGLIAAILLGGFFRTVWGNDIEYKADERWSFEHSQAIVHGAALPATGMPSSVGLPNTGLSIWIFAALTELSGATDPPGLARAVQVTNIAAILLLLLFVCCAVPVEEREAWFWAVAFVSVNPLTVVLQRKIWPPSVLPIFTVFMTLGWWYRGRAWGALLWGIAGSLIGQIQLGSAFLSPGFALWALLFDRKSIAWRYWLLGSLLASLPALPWLWEILQGHDAQGGRLHWENLVMPLYWGMWIEQAVGLGLEHSLGGEFWSFLGWPTVAGQRTYAMLILHIGIVAVAIAGAWPLLRAVREGRQDLRDLLVGRGSRTDLAVSSALWGYGFLLTASLLQRVHGHYLIVLFFFQTLSLARVVLRGNGETGRSRAHSILLLLWFCQCLLTWSFLDYVHEKQSIDGDYGATWGSQQSGASP